MAQARSAEARRFVKAPSKPLLAPPPLVPQRPYRPLVGLLAHADAPRRMIRAAIVVISIVLVALALVAMAALGSFSAKIMAPELPVQFPAESSRR